jgi:hypothetical protein
MLQSSARPSKDIPGTVLVFDDPVVKSLTTSEIDMVDRVEHQMQTIMTLTASIKTLDKRFGLRRDYLIWTKKAGKDGAPVPISGPGSGDVMDLGWDELEIDEEAGGIEA